MSATNTITATRARPITPDEACWLAADGSIWASVLDAKTGAMNEYVIDLPPMRRFGQTGKIARATPRIGTCEIAGLPPREWRSAAGECQGRCWAIDAVKAEPALTHAALEQGRLRLLALALVTRYSHVDQHHAAQALDRWRRRSPPRRKSPRYSPLLRRSVSEVRVGAPRFARGRRLPKLRAGCSSHPGGTIIPRRRPEWPLG